jgi:hypothetical protein
MAMLPNTWRISLHRKHLSTVLLLSASCFVGACSSIGGLDMKSMYTVAKSMWARGQGVTLDEAAAVPYASMGLRVGDSTQIMLILAADEGGQRLWTSSSGIAITTRDGRIVRTAGISYDMSGFVAQSDVAEGSGSRVVRWQADFPDLGFYSIAVVCRDRVTGDEVIVILGKEIHTRHVEEKCRTESSQLNWSFKNNFWLDPSDGMVWRSTQHVHPKLDAIETETLRPPV